MKDNCIAIIQKGNYYENYHSLMRVIRWISICPISVMQMTHLAGTGSVLQKSCF